MTADEELRPDVAGLTASLVELARDLRVAGDLVDDWARHHAPARGARELAELAAGDLYAGAALVKQSAGALARAFTVEPSQ